MHFPLQSLQGPFHAVGLLEINKPVIVNSIAEPIFKAMQEGATYLANKLTLSKLVKAGFLLGSVQAMSSIPTADAGFGLFALCMSTCLASTGGAFPPMCWAICCGTVPTPTP
ncbi:hypothetical protein JTE90_025372 [Oedothorax gibbosus]|nr:hypothetical protein JTE90_025372 [Oedothorax gibbosus]